MYVCAPLVGDDRGVNCAVPSISGFSPSLTADAIAMDLPHRMMGMLVCAILSIRLRACSVCKVISCACNVRRVAKGGA